MSQVSKGEGRTVLFVSHNMASIQKLCNNCIILNNGTIYSQGNIHNCIVEYINIQKPHFGNRSKLDENYRLEKVEVKPQFINSLGEFQFSFINFIHCKNVRYRLTSAWSWCI